jgi:predicted RNA-binding protein with PIN domain
MLLNVTQVTRSFTVATHDAMIQLAGQSAGAYCMSAELFIDELKSMKKAISHRVKAVVAKANLQAMHPEKLQGTHFHNFGRNQKLIEDK